MTSAKNTPWEQLTDKIGVLLANGITAGETVRAYLDTTFLNPSPAAINALVQNETHAERDSLVDLFLFPDEAFQFELEPFLIRHPFTGAEEQQVIRRLAAMRPGVVIRLPWFREKLNLIPTPSELRHLINRLNITWQADQKIDRAIENNVSADKQVAVRVRLRNADLKTDAAAIHVLCRFLDVFSDSGDRFFEYFDFLVAFLGRIPEEDPYRALIREKRRLLAELQQTVRFQQQLCRYNMEILMLRGIRSPAESTAGIRKRIATIDDIVAALFNRPDSDFIYNLNP